MRWPENFPVAGIGGGAGEGVRVAGFRERKKREGGEVCVFLECVK